MMTMIQAREEGLAYEVRPSSIQDGLWAVYLVSGISSSTESVEVASGLDYVEAQRWVRQQV